MKKKTSALGALNKMSSFFYSNIYYILNNDYGISWDAIQDEVDDQDMMECVSAKLSRKQIKKTILKSKWAQKALEDLVDDAVEEFYTRIEMAKQCKTALQTEKKDLVEKALLADSLTKDQKRKLKQLFKIDLG